MPLAYIVWIDAGAHPEHPIAPGGPPPGIWPSPGHPAHPIYNPPGIWPSPGHPAHPIAPGGPPPSVWPSPGHPAHPIVIPPTEPGKPPLVIWGPGDPMPTPPIELPPSGGEKPPEGGPPVQIIDWKVAWTPTTGWIVVGVPNIPHPAPAK